MQAGIECRNHAMPHKKQYSKLAIASFVMSVVALVYLIVGYMVILASSWGKSAPPQSSYLLLIILTSLLMTASIVTGILGLRKIKRYDKPLLGDEMAWFGIGMSLFLVLLGCILLKSMLFSSPDPGIYNDLR